MREGNFKSNRQAKFVFFFLSTFSFLFLLSSFAYALNPCVWISDVPGNYSSPGNWNNCGGVAPVAGDTVTFNGAHSGDCTIDAGASASVISVTISAGYSGTITQSRSFTITNTYSQASGTYTDTASTLNMASFSQTGGTFNAPNSSGSMSITSTFSQSGGVTSIFNASSGTITVGGDFSLFTSGTTFNGSSGTLNLNGTNFTLNGGTFKAPSGTLNFAGSFFLPNFGGTFSNNSGTVVFNGNAVDQYINYNGGTGIDGATVNFNNFNLNQASNTNSFRIYSNNTVNVAGLLSLTRGNYNSGFSGHLLVAQGTLSVASTFTGSSNLGNLRISGSGIGTVTLPAGVQMPSTTLFSGTNANLTTSATSGQTVTFLTLSISAGSVDFSSSAANLTVSSNTTGLTVSGGACTMGSGVLDMASTTLSSGTLTISSGTTNFSGAYTHTAGGTFNNNNGTAVFRGNSANVNVGVGASTSETFNNLTINKNSGQAVNITSGKTLIATATLSMTGGSANTGTLEARATVSVGSSYEGGTSPLTFTNTADQSFTLLKATPDNYNGDITINKAGGTVTLASALVMDAANQDLAITSGTFSLAGNNLTVNGSTGTFSVASAGTFQLQGGETITLNVANPTLSAGSTVKYIGMVGPYTLKNYSYSNLTIAGGAAVVFSLPGALTGIATTTITTSILSLGGSNISMTTLSNDSTFRLQGGETVTITNGMDADSGTTEYVGNGATSYASLAAGNNYYALTFNNATGSWTHTSSLDVNSNLTISAGTLNSGGQNITIAGNWSNAGTYTSGSNTVTFDGGGVQSLTTGGTGTGQDFQNLTVSKGGGTLSLVTNNLDVDGTLTVSGGTFSPGALSTTAGALTTNGGTFTGGAGAIDVNGVFTLSSGVFTSSSTTMTLSGNFDHSGGGTFTHNSGTVNLDGTDQSILGTTTFNNLTKTTSSAATLTFPAGLTNTMVGTLTLTGATNAHLSLVSSTPSSQAFIDPQGSRTAQYLTVTDNNNANASAITCNGCTNGGGNTNWLFAAQTVTWDGGGAGNNWSTAANWSNDTIPGQSDTATFNGTSSKNATIDTAIDVAGINIATGYTGIITQAAAVTLGSSGFTQSTGTFTGGSQTITISGSMNISGGAFTSTSGTLSLTGDFINTGTTFTHNSGTVTFNGTGAHSLNSGGTGAGQTFNNINVSKGGGTLSLVTNNLNAAGTLTVGAGGFSIGPLAVSAATLTVSGGTFTGAVGSVTVTGTTTVSSGTFTQSSSAMSTTNLTVNGGTFNAGSVTLTVGTKLTTSSGTFTGSSGTLDINGGANDAFTLSGGTFTAPSGNFTLAGGFNHIAGTFNHNSGTVTLDGTDQTIAGSTTFNNLTKNVTVALTLTLPAGVTNTFVGTLTLTGTSGNLLSLVSSSPGIQTQIDPQGARTAQFLNVSYNNNINPTTLSCASCTNLGNNTNWSFSALVRTWDGGGIDNNWSTAANWSGDATPSSTDVALFNGTSTKDATIDTPISVAGITISTGYTGTITQGGSSTVAIGDQSFTQSTGTFTGVSESIAVTDGSFSLSGGIFTSTSGTFSLTGDFNHTAGTFNANSGILLLNGENQTISGSTTFNNLTKNATTAKTLTLPAGATNVIAGTLNLTGTNGNLLSLVSSSPGSQTSINPQGTRTAEYLSVIDNNNVNATSLLCITGCVNGGNNTNWDFSGSVTANAGPDRTIVTTTSSKVSSINLDGTGSTGTDLIYSWEITSTTGSGGVSQAGTLTDADTATPLYTAPTTAQVVTITLTVRSNSGSAAPSSDTVTMTILDPNNVSKQTSTQKIVGIMNGVTIIQNSSSLGSTYLTLNNLNLLLPSASGGYSFTLNSNNQMIIGFPEYNNGAGEVCLSTVPVTTLSGTINLNEGSTTGFLCIPGSQSSGLFGQYVAVGDFNSDGNSEAVISAPGEGSYGTAYLADFNGNFLATIIGTAQYPVSSILVADYLDNPTPTISFGPGNPSLNPNLNFNPFIFNQTSQAFFLVNPSGTIVLDNATINGAAGDVILTPPNPESQPKSQESQPESRPESQPNPNNQGVFYNSQALGDVNADGNTDLILVSDATVYIFFGRQALDSTLTLADADVVITGGSSADGFGQMVLTGDLTGDGINDVVIGAPYASSNRGVIYVIFGSTQWESAMDLNTNAQVFPITGDNSGDQIGSDFLITQGTLYTVKANGQVLIINLVSSQQNSGGGCNVLSNNSSNFQNPFFMLFSLFIFSIFKMKIRKKREVKF